MYPFSREKEKSQMRTTQDRLDFNDLLGRGQVGESCPQFQRLADQQEVLLFRRNQFSQLGLIHFKIYNLNN